MLRYITRSGHWGLAGFYLIVSVGLGYLGWHLQHVVFHAPPPPGQVFAAVFVQDPAAHVSLSAEIYPEAPWTDSLSLTVTGVSPRESGWLLVIECPGNAPYPTPAVRLYSFSAAVSMTQSAPTAVGVYAGTGSGKSGIYFNCFVPSGISSGLRGASRYSPSLADVSVPALQLDQAMAANQAIPLVYALQSFPGGPVSRLVEVFPGAGCPAASVPANPTCLGLAPAGATVIPYGIPGTETTTDTLNHVNPAGYQISMFPVGSTMGNSIVWNSSQSALDPNFNATNTAAENDASRDIFISGILFGILGGTAVGCVEHAFEALRARKSKPAYRSIGL